MERWRARRRAHQYLVVVVSHVASSKWRLRRARYHRNAPRARSLVGSTFRIAHTHVEPLVVTSVWCCPRASRVAATAGPPAPIGGSGRRGSGRCVPGVQDTRRSIGPAWRMAITCQTPHTYAAPPIAPRIWRCRSSSRVTLPPVPLVVVPVVASPAVRGVGGWGGGYRRKLCAFPSDLAKYTS